MILEAQDRASEAFKRVEGAEDELAAKTRLASAATDQWRDANGRLHDSHGRFMADAEEAGASTSRLRSLLDRVSISFDRAEKDSNGFGNSVKDAGAKANDASGLIRKIAIATAALAGPATGLLALGVPAIFGGIGAAVFSMKNSIDQAKASGQTLTATQKAAEPVIAILTKAYGSLGPVVKSTGIELLHTIGGLAPAFTTAAHALAPMITVLGHGLSGFLTNLIPALAVLMTHLLPVVSALGGGLAVLGKGLAGLFTNLNLNAAAAGLTQLFGAIGAILPLVGKLLSALAPLSNVIFSTLLPPLVKLVTTLVGALEPVLARLGPALKPIADTLVALGQAFGQLLAAVIPLIIPILQFFGAFNNLDTPLERIGSLLASVARALLPLFGIVGQIANLVANFLNAAFTKLAAALIPLIPPLSNLAHAILVALLSSLKAAEPALMALVDAFVQMLPYLIPVINTLARFAPVLVPLVVAFLSVKTALGIVGSAFKTVTGLLTANPYVALIAATVLIVTLIVTHWTAIKNFFVGVWHAIVSALDTANYAMIAAFSATLHFIESLWHTVWSAVKNFVVGIWRDIVSALNTANYEMVAFFSRGLHDVESLWHTVWTAVWSFVKSWWPILLGVFTGGLGLIIGAVIKWHSQIIGFFAGAGSWLYNAGKNIIEGLINGIENMAGKLWSKVESIGSGITNRLKSVLHILSPSRVMADEVGRYIPLGIAQGITDNAHVAAQAAETLARRTITGATSGLGYGGGIPVLPGAAAAGGGITIDLRGSQVMSDRDMDVLVQKVGRAMSTRILPQAGVRISM